MDEVAVAEYDEALEWLLKHEGTIRIWSSKTTWSMCLSCVMNTIAHYVYLTASDVDNTPEILTYAIQQLRQRAMYGNLFGI